MFDHVTIRASDRDASERFYTGIRLADDTPERAQFRAGRGSFSLVAGDAPTAHVHLAFGAGDNAAVDAFHAAAVGAGYRDFGAPGERSAYHDGYCGAFVLDPDGNNVDVVNHNR